MALRVAILVLGLSALSLVRGLRLEVPGHGRVELLVFSGSRQ